MTARLLEQLSEPPPATIQHPVVGPEAFVQKLYPPMACAENEYAAGEYTFPPLHCPSLHTNEKGSSATARNPAARLSLPEAVLYLPATKLPVPDAVLLDPPGMVDIIPVALFWKPPPTVASSEAVLSKPPPTVPSRTAQYWRLPDLRRRCHRRFQRRPRSRGKSRR